MSTAQVHKISCVTTLVSITSWWNRWATWSSSRRLANNRGSIWRRTICSFRPKRISGLNEVAEQCFSDKVGHFTVQGVSLGRERFWVALTEMNAPLWSPTKLLELANLVTNSMQKTRFKNIRKRRPRGSSTENGSFAIFQWSLSWQMTTVQWFIRGYNESWRTQSRCYKNNFDSLNQTIIVRGAPVT